MTAHSARFSSRRLGAAVGAALVAWSCSSVPDVVFLDRDDRVAPASASNDADANEPDAPVFACPDRAPPSGQGVCCPDGRLCLRGDQSRCDECAAAGCDGIEKVCCVRNKHTIDCKPQASCE